MYMGLNQSSSVNTEQWHRFTDIILHVTICYQKKVGVMPYTHNIWLLKASSVLSVYLMNCHLLLTMFCFVFIFCILWCLGRFWRDCLSQTANNLPSAPLSYANQPISPDLLSTCHTPHQYVPSLSHPGPGTGHLETMPTALSMPQLSQQPSPKLAATFLSHPTHPFMWKAQ